MSTVTSGTHLRVLFLPPEIDKQLSDYSFACVVSRAPGEQLFNVTKPCLHVLHSNTGKFEFADGMYFLKEVKAIGEPIEWPVLCEALSRPVKAYSKPLMPKLGELPFQRIMLWHKYRHMNPPLGEDAAGHALLALQAAQKWNGWMTAAGKTTAQKWGFDDALKDVCSANEWAKLVDARKQFDAGEAFRKFCESIGLKRPHPTDFDTPHAQLIEILRIALQLHQGVRDSWTDQATQ